VQGITEILPSLRALLRLLLDIYVLRR